MISGLRCHPERSRRVKGEFQSLLIDGGGGTY